VLHSWLGVVFFGRMLEPRGTLHSVTLLNTFNVQKQTNINTLLLPTTNDDQNQNNILLYERSYYEEPEIPVHPALEFEIHTTEVIESTLSQPLLMSSSSSSSSTGAVPQSSSPSSSSTKHQFNSNEENSLQKQQQQQQQQQQQTYSLRDSNEPLNITSQNNINIQHNDEVDDPSKVDTCNDLQFWIAILCLIISGVGIVITLKLQAIPMYVFMFFFVYK
jgi:hypothetical protein